MIRDHFSLNAWMPTIRANYGDLNLLGFGIDWYSAGSIPPYYAIDAHLLGFGASLVFWPKGKEWGEDDPWFAQQRERGEEALREQTAYLHDFGPNVPVESLGREHADGGPE